jgi:hypothetical protein
MPNLPDVVFRITQDGAALVCAGKLVTRWDASQWSWFRPRLVPPSTGRQAALLPLSPVQPGASAGLFFSRLVDFKEDEALRRLLAAACT